MKRSVGSSVIMIGFLLVALPASAEIPRTLAFQGKLTAADGQPLEGPVTVTFRLYDAATAGTRLWEESQMVQVANGLFSTALGQSIPLTLAFDKPYWLESQVGVQILSPRQPLTATPYAIQAQTADRARSVDGLAIQDGKVGIGTSNPQNTLNVQGTTGAQISLGTTAPGSRPELMLENDTTFWGISVRPDLNNAFVVRTSGSTGYRLVVHKDGRVGVGHVPDPRDALEVDGYVRAHGYHTGDIVFHKGEQPVWRMYEDEEGLYVESLTTGRHYQIELKPLPVKAEREGKGGTQP